jgi:hypothetical protein
MLPALFIIVLPLGLIIKLFVANAPPASAKYMAPPVTGLAGNVAVTAALLVLTPYLPLTLALKLDDCIEKAGSPVAIPVN